LGGDSQVVGLILEGIETFAALRDLVDVVTHHTDRVVDLLRLVSIVSDGAATGSDRRLRGVRGAGGRVALEQ